MPCTAFFFFCLFLNYFVFYFYKLVMNKFTHSACRQDQVTAPSFIFLQTQHFTCFVLHVCNLNKIYMEFKSGSDTQMDTFNC